MSGVVVVQRIDLGLCGLQVDRHQTILTGDDRFGQRGPTGEGELIDRRALGVFDVQPVVVTGRNRKRLGVLTLRCLQPHGQRRSSVVDHRQCAGGGCHNCAVGGFHDLDRHGICASLVAYDVDMGSSCIARRKCDACGWHPPGHIDVPPVAIGVLGPQLHMRTRPHRGNADSLRRGVARVLERNVDGRQRLRRSIQSGIVGSLAARLLAKQRTGLRDRGVGHTGQLQHGGTVHRD